MSSGIYQLHFSDGSFYIGKSENMEERWNQHTKSFLQGMHSKKMQSKYNQYGPPVASVLLECHTDHIDLYESLAIHKNMGPNCLNSAIPKKLTADEESVLLKAGEHLTASTAEHIATIEGLRRSNRILEVENEQAMARNKELEDKGVVLRPEIRALLNELEYENSSLIREISTLNTTIKGLRSRNILERIFNV